MISPRPSPGSLTVHLSDQMVPFRRVLIAASAAALFAGCNNGSTGPDVGAARVIFVHAIADTGNLDLRVSGRLTQPLSAIPFGTGTIYQSIKSGVVTFSVQAAPSTSGESPRPLANLSGILVGGGSAVTIVAAGIARDSGTARAAAVTGYLDDVSIPAGGQARLRIINASPDAGAVDVYVTPSGGVRSATPTFVGVDYRSALTRSVAPGSYDLTITELSDAAAVLASASVTLPASGAQTVVVRGYSGPMPVGLPLTRKIATTTTVNVAP